MIFVLDVTDLMRLFAVACIRFMGQFGCRDIRDPVVGSLDCTEVLRLLSYMMHPAKNTPYIGTGTKRSASCLGPTRKPQTQNSTASSPEK